MTSTIRYYVIDKSLVMMFLQKTEYYVEQVEKHSASIQKLLKLKRKTNASKILQCGCLKRFRFGFVMFVRVTEFFERSLTIEKWLIENFAEKGKQVL